MFLGATFSTTLGKSAQTSLSALLLGLGRLRPAGACLFCLYSLQKAVLYWEFGETWYEGYTHQRYCFATLAFARWKAIIRAACIYIILLYNSREGNR